MNRNYVDSQSPPKNIVPGLIPAEQVLSQTDSAVLWVPIIRVFPNGIICDLELIHTDIPEQHRRRLILQDYTVQLSVDGNEAHFTLGNPPGLATDPFPLVFWRRSSSANGAVAAVWVGQIPSSRLSIKAISKNTGGQRLLIGRDEIDSAMSRVIRVGGDDHPGDSGLVFLG